MRTTRVSLFLRACMDNYCLQMYQTEQAGSAIESCGDAGCLTSRALTELGVQQNCFQDSTCNILQAFVLHQL